MTTTILVTSFSAFWVEADSAWAFATCWKGHEFYTLTMFDHKTTLMSSHHFESYEKLRIAKNDGGKWNSEAKAEEEHHIGLIVVFVVGCVPVRTTRALQAFWDVPARTQRELRLLSWSNSVALTFRMSFSPAPSQQRWNWGNQCKYPGEYTTRCSMFRLESNITKRFADDQPSFKSNHSQRPQAYHTWENKEEVSLLLTSIYCNLMWRKPSHLNLTP